MPLRQARRSPHVLIGAITERCGNRQTAILPFLVSHNTRRGFLGKKKRIAALEEWTRSQVQKLMQSILEEEVTHALGQVHSGRGFSGFYLLLSHRHGVSSARAVFRRLACATNSNGSIGKFVRSRCWNTFEFIAGMVSSRHPHSSSKIFFGLG